MAELRTVITLRQGTTAEWLTSPVVLRQGEVGLEYLADGSVKIKAGDGERFWADLSYIGGDFSAPLGDGKTIEVSTDGTISLLGAETAAIGTLPIIGDNGKIVWKTLENVGAGDGNDNTTYEFSALENEDNEIYGIQIQVKENGIATGEPIVIDFDVYTKEQTQMMFEAVDARLQNLEKKEDADTTYSVNAEEKILKLEGTEFSTAVDLNYITATENEPAKLQLLGIDNAVVSEIDATPFIKDGMLHDVDYDAENNKLTFVWNTEAGEKTDEVILSDIIEPYLAGEGLQLKENTFSVKIDEISEGFLSVGSEGLKLTGIQDAIDAAEARAAEDAQTKANEVLLLAQEDAASTYATKAYVGVIPDNYTEDNLISYINKKAEEVLAASQGGSSESAAAVKEQLDNYKSENDTKVNALTSAVEEINENVVPGIMLALENKVESNVIYTKEEIGIIEEGKTLVQMIQESKVEEYDDTELRNLISAEESRAFAAEQAIEGRLSVVETFFAAVETPDETIDTLAEIVKYIEEDKSGASAMLASIQSNTTAISVINSETDGILAQAKSYTDEQIATIPIAGELLGLVKGSDSDNQIKVEEDGSMTVNRVSVNKLYVEEGDELILNGGSAL